MCVGFWSLDHPDYALILCTNRDEYLSRATSDAHFHSFEREGENCQQTAEPFVLSGLDLQAGGSWFGINRVGRVALLTNITEVVSRSFKSSRGQLVSSFLLPSALNVDEYVRDLTNREPSADYAGFNLVLLSPSGNTGADSLSYNGSLVTNSGGGGAITCRPLSTEEQHIGGVSNGVDGVNAHLWPKVVEGVHCMSELFNDSKAMNSSSEDELTEHLFSLLARHSAECPTNRSQLRNSIQITPLAMSSSLAPDAKLDHTQGHTVYYGTRLSSVLLVRRDGRVTFIERDIWQLQQQQAPVPSADLDKNGASAVVRGDPRAQRVFRFYLAGAHEPSESVEDEKAREEKSKGERTGFAST